MKRTAIAIIGGGCSGTLVALNLLRRSSGRAFDITIVERSKDFGLGLAYNVPSDRCKLNVPAHSMSAFSDEPDSFLKWAVTIDPEIKGSHFVSRRIFGLYLQHLIQEHSKNVSNCSLRCLQSEAVDVTFDRTTRAVRIDLLESAPLYADFCVLSFGNLERSSFCGVNARSTFYNPYKEDTYLRLADKDNILIIGSSLTAVDSILEAEGAGFRGTYTIVSRHGRTPLPHETPSNIPLSSDFSAAALSRLSIRSLTSLVVKEARSQGSSQAVITAIRPHIQKIWQELSLSDKKRFLRHVKPIWEVHRHRIPQEHHAALEKLKVQGRLEVIAGRLQNIQRRDEYISVHILSCSGSSERSFDGAILCAGPEGDISKIQLPLIRNMVSRGTLVPGLLGLGGVLAGECATSSRVWLLGPPQREDLWEITAVREIRLEAERIAEELCSRN